MKDEEATKEGVVDLAASIVEQAPPLAVSGERGVAARAEAELAAIEDGILSTALGVVEGVLAFTEIEQYAESIPEEWVAKYGEKAARRRFAAARAGWANAKQAPVGTKIAAQVAVGMMRARAAKDSGPKTLNIKQVAVMYTKPKQYVEMEVED